MPAVLIVAVFIVQILTSQTEELFEREMCGDAVASESRGLTIGLAMIA